MEEVGEAIKLNPKPGYVLKSHILQSETVLPGTKVFINICQDPQVPQPPVPFDPNVVFPLIVDNKWEIPIIVSREKTVKDKKGQTSYCYDCCINDTCFRWSIIDSNLKLILNEWCIEAVEILYGLVLDRQYTTPKMASKGELSQTEMKKSELSDTGLHKKLDDLKKDEALALVEEMKVDDKEEEDIDIFGRKVAKKPLIEEIETPVKTAETLKPSLSPTGPTVKAQLSYEVTFQKVSKPFSLVVKFKSHLPHQYTKLETDNDTLYISSTSLEYQFDTKFIKIPLPISPNTIECFHVSGLMYIFCD